MPRIDVLAAVVCEEVRQEASGKAIIIGAAPVGPEVSSTDETIIPRIAFYMEAILCEIDSVDFRLFSEEHDDVPLNVTMQLNPSPDNDTLNGEILGVIVFGRENVTIRQSGTYKLQYSLHNNVWETIKDIIFPPSHDDT